MERNYIHITEALLRKLLIPTFLLLFTAPTYARDIADVVGVVHWGGKYNFTSQDYLNEGADRISQLGSRVIKVAISSNPATDYQFNSPQWPAAGATLLQTAQTSYFQTLFQKNFTTFIVVAATSCGEFSDGFTTAEYDCEYNQMHDLAAYLINSYAYTGKTFVLQNWEGDNKLNGTFNETSFTGMKRYLTARQAAVANARSELSYIGGVTVLNAAEVNLVSDAAAGYPRAANMVLPGLRTSPYLEPDLYSYSVWDFDTESQNPDRLIANLDFLAAETAATHDRIYIGEYGTTNHIDDTTDRDQVARLTQSALTWGVKYLTYWEVFSNEMPATTWWLVRPDGSLTPLWYYFQSLMPSSIYRGTFQNLAYGTYLSAAADGTISAPASSPSSAATTFALLDLNGGAFLRDDHVALLTSRGTYMTAEGGGGGVVDASRYLRGPWEEFVLEDDFPSDGVITNGDTLVFTAADGHDVRAYSPYDAAAPGAVRADSLRNPPSYIDYDVLWQVSFH